MDARELGAGAMRAVQDVVIIDIVGSFMPTLGAWAWHQAGHDAIANATLIRINLREPAVPAGQTGLALGALEALRGLDALIKER